MIYKLVTVIQRFFFFFILNRPCVHSVFRLDLGAEKENIAICYDIISS